MDPVVLLCQECGPGWLVLGREAEGQLGKAHPSLIVFQVLTRKTSFAGSLAEWTPTPLFGAGDKNLGFTCKFFYKE